MEKKERKITLSSIKSIGIKGYIFALIGQYVQKKLGKMVGVEPGADMLAAVESAKKIQARVALIDQDLSITLKNFSNRLSWKERWQFVKDIFRAIFFRKKMIKELGVENFDLSKVPSNEIIKKMLKQLKKNYPNIYSVLIEERNQIMSKNIYGLMNHFPDHEIVAVIGAGHEEDMLELIKQRFEQSALDHDSEKPDKTSTPKHH